MINNNTVWLINDAGEIVRGLVCGDYYYKDGVQHNDVFVQGSSTGDRPVSMSAELLFDSELSITQHLLFKVMAEVAEVKEINAEVKEIKSKIENEFKPS